jgi:hypothetical protein
MRWSQRRRRKLAMTGGMASRVGSRAFARKRAQNDDVTLV